MVAWAGALAAACFMSGCASAPQPEWEDGRIDLETRPPLPLEPAVAWLFTNQPPFQAKVAITRPGDSADHKPAPARLAGAGGRLHYTTDYRDRDDQPRNMSFVWDATTESGYAMSEALQGYAQVAAAGRLASVQAQEPEGALFEKIDRQETRRRKYLATLENGATMEVNVWESTEARGFPMRIEGRTSAGTVTATLSDVRFENPPAGLFVPPEGFSRFESTDRMVSELLRRLTVRRRQGRRDLDYTQPPEFRRQGVGMY